MKASKILLVFLFFLSALGLNAQNLSLVVTMADATTETFAIADIQSVKFGSHTMILSRLDGTINTWDIEDIDNYAFSDNLSVDDLNSLISSDLSIYPNPSADNVNISYSSNATGLIRIEVYDNNGRMVEQVFMGDHQESTKVTWSAKSNSSVQSGQYLIKLTTGNKVITKPVIIH